MVKPHLMLDCETFGQDSTKCAVIDVSSNIFDWDRFTSSKPYSFDELLRMTTKYKLSVTDQVKNHGYVVEANAVNWWTNQNESARKNVSAKKDDLSLEEFCERFLGEISEFNKIEYWWSRSNIFDPIIIMRLFDSFGNLELLRQYLPPWKVRDVRTFIDSKLDFPIPNKFVPIKNQKFWKEHFKEHDSAHDVVADILRMQSIVRAENDLEQVEQ